MISNNNDDSTYIYSSSMSFKPRKRLTRYTLKSKKKNINVKPKNKKSRVIVKNTTMLEQSRIQHKKNKIVILFLTTEKNGKLSNVRKCLIHCL